MALYVLLSYFTSATLAKITWLSLVSLHAIDSDKIKIRQLFQDQVLKASYCKS